ncbi:DNA-directed DNA polymerase zeta catalytic subunit REV3 [Aspergillus mulundensis]|uniref:DNA polymerase n=1 Tax=Aspergillus mulundensis TaxID=1810919 RepID=A0A3D8SJ48_9EURO|nr:DNA polymerase [Aspergillus mulundensis]RDW86204.1 DNA polymerase [Aspergillus mulundensis]
MEPFQVRLNCVDHYQANPSEFDPPLPYRDGNSEKNYRPKVPVIRIFGTTETGQKICVHVHGAFPYLYVQYDGDLSPDAVRSAARSLHLSIDHALAVSYRRNAYDKKTAFVGHITLVKGVPFYGYHVGYRFFFKIYLLNPIYITRLADLLLQGAVMKRPIQPYESHLQYVPQWMCDYNLFGCAFMKCSKAKFRSPIPEYLDLPDLSHRWHDRSIPPDWISDEGELGKQSHCPLEADVCVQDILNRLEINERSIHHDFGEFLKPVASNEKLVPSMAGLWQDEKRRRKRKIGLEDPESSPFSTEDLVSFSSDPRKNSQGDWIHKDEFQELITQIAAEERGRDSDKDATLDGLLRDNPYTRDIKTALESIEDFFPGPDGFANLQLPYSSENEYIEGQAQDYVDEDAARTAELDAGHYSSDENGMVDIFSDDDYEETENEMEQADLENDMQQEENSDASSHAHGSQVPVPSVTGLRDSTGLEVPPSDVPSTWGTGNFKTPTRPNLESDHPRQKYFETLSSSFQALERPGLVQTWKANPESGINELSTPIRTTEPSSSLRQSSSQQTIRPKGNSQHGTLNFPVVKDPNDPMTVLRFSQEASSSKVLLAMVAKGPSNSGDSESTLQLPSSPVAGLSSSLDIVASDFAAPMFEAFNIPPGTRLGCLRRACPEPAEVSSTLNSYGLSNIIYSKAHYSTDSDVPDRPRDYAGREFHIEGVSIRYLPNFDPSGRLPAILAEESITSKARCDWEEVDNELRVACTARFWEFAPVPPSRSEVITWFEDEQRKAVTATTKTKEKRDEKESRVKALSQIEGPTQKNDHGFKYSQNEKSTSVEHQAQYMSTMSLEVHVNTRGVLSPNPEDDEIASFFWCINSEEDPDEIPSGVVFQGEGKPPELKISKALRFEWEHEPTELDLINRLVDIVRLYDPDIITGYEVHNGSWGYVIERARKKYDFDLCDELSRVKSQAHGRFGKEADKWGFNHASSIRVTGRHIINIWRAMRSEMTLLQYTMENVVFHLLHRRIPHYSFQDLTSWYQSDKPRDFMKVINYFSSRVKMNIEIINANELIPRTSEQARLLGIDFYSVFSRGSQFKVESLMFRIAKPENFMLVSPSRKQVGQQNALECLPLVMEPQSDFYTSPLIVLDFQSLYPSIMIAYNYCYSTFLGRVQSWRGRNKMGFMDYNRQPRLLELLRDHINIAPNGMIYAKSEVRKSLLAKMLAEILETRVMVKTGMKTDKDDRALQRLLNNRQLALKLIANVTYGYTSASFSGRMPCAEIADSIVQSGRETLEKAIAYIHSVERWGAEVVYGDTDSLFVYLKGRTRDQAFDIGEEIAQAVTEMNPQPIKLKFEKVYHPCVLLAKKRYVGFKYEQRDQKQPEFDAKGIETVRRDGTPAEQKIEEKALKLLFRTSDLSQVKSYFQSQCTKIMEGRVSVQDFCFARAVKLGTYSENGTLPAGALISTKKMLEDPRAEPQYGERIPYVVVTGAPGSRLIDRCVPPETLLQDAQLDLDAEYYITKNLIPPLERIFNLVGANVRQWYDEMPKVHRIRRVEGTSSVVGGKSSIRTLESYMKASTCIVCKTKLYDAEVPLCSDCVRQSPISLLELVSRQRQAEQRVANLERVCRSCMDVPFGDEVKCDSLDCPVFYARTRSLAHWRHTNAVLDPVIKLLEDNCGDELEW